MGNQIIPEYRLKKSMYKEELTEKEAMVILKDLRINKLNQVKDLEPVLARGVADHLIQYVDDDKGEPRLFWKHNLIENLSLDQLQMLCNVLENKKEVQQRKY